MAAQKRAATSDNWNAKGELEMLLFAKSEDGDWFMFDARIPTVSLGRVWKNTEEGLWYAKFGASIESGRTRIIAAEKLLEERRKLRNLPMVLA